MRPPYRSDIDGLRAVAVLLVVIFHAFPRRLAGGFVGVDVFFVISGFLITSLILRSLDNSDFSFADFYARRIKRIFPALIAVLAFCLLFGWFFLFPGEYRDLGKHSTAGAAFIANFSFLQETGYFDITSDHKPLLHLWSLGIEEQFYIVWPALVVLAWRWRSGPIVMACLICLGSFLCNIVVTRTNAALAFYLPFTRFWELMIGCIIAFATPSDGSPISLPARFAQLASFHRRHRQLLDNAAGLLGLTMIIVAAFVIRPSWPFPGWWALMPTCGAALLILAGPQSWINRWLLSHRAIVYIGLISYPLYLWHWPILTFARMVHLKEPTELMKVACIAAAVVLADLTYRYIERPIRFGPPTARKPVMASIAMVAVGCLGLFIYASGGLASRFPKELQNLVGDIRNNESEDNRQYRCVYMGTKDMTFPASCDGTDQPGTRHVVLWGDSHAAQLGPGLDELRRNGGNFQLAQYSSAGCPPVLKFESAARPNCAPVNELVVEKIARLKPDTVILAARWELYDGVSGFGLADTDAIRATIARLKFMNVNRVVVAGQFPIWQTNVPQLRAQNYRMFAAGFTAATPQALERDKSRLAPRTFAGDQRIRQAVAPTDATLVSPMETLCNDDGCLLVIPNSSGKPIYWDDNHLTRSGSIYFIAATAPALIGP